MSGLVATWAAACCRWRNGADAEACHRAPVHGADTSQLEHRLTDDREGASPHRRYPADADAAGAAVDDHHHASDGAGGETACFDSLAGIVVCTSK